MLVSQSVHSVLTPGGRHDWRFLDGNDGAAAIPLSWSAPADIVDIQEGTTPSYNLAALYVSQPSPATATFAVSSGTLPAGWTLSGAGVLAYSGTGQGSATIRVTATRATVAVPSPPFLVRSIASLSADTVAPTIPLSVTATASATGITVAFHQTSDPQTATQGGSGMKQYPVYRDGSGTALPSPVLSGALGLTPRLTGVDVGSVSSAGSTTQTGNNYSLVSDGIGIGGVAENGQMGYYQLTGDFEFTVKVNAVTGSDPLRNVTLLMRESLAPGARMWALRVNGTGLRVRSRDILDATSTGLGSALNGPTWPLSLRLTRVGNTLNGLYSTDGNSFASLYTGTFTAATTVYVCVLGGTDGSGIITVDLQQLTIQNLPPLSVLDPITDGLSHSYRVKAQDVANNLSALSASVSATAPSGADVTAPTVPGPPTGSGPNTTTVSWAWGASIDTQSGVRGYIPSLSSTQGGAYVDQPETPNLSFSTSTGITAGTTRWLKVRAVDNAGNESANTTAVSATSAAASAPADGAIVTFTGTGFGTNAAVQGFFGGVNGPVEQAADGIDIKTGVNLGTGWSYPAGDPQFISTARAYSGTKSILNRYGHNTPTGGSYNTNFFAYGIQWDPGAAFQSIYTNSIWYLANNGNTDGQVKFNRWVGAAGGGVADGNLPNVLMSQYPGSGASQTGGLQMNSNYGAIPNISFGAGDIWAFNGWVRQETWFVPGTSGNADGTFQWRVTRLSDGVVISSGSVSAKRFWGSTDPAYRYPVWQGYIGNTMQSDGAQLNLDRDAYAIVNIGSTAFPKFVYLADAATWGSVDKTKCAVQPFTSWSDLSITVTLNKGMHASLIGKYFYVMSGIDTPINTTGIPIPSGPDTTPPTVPTNNAAAGFSSTVMRITSSGSTDTGSGVAGYRLYEGPALQGPFTLVNPTTLITAFPYDRTGVNPNTTLFYKLTGVDAASPANESAQSGTFSGTTQGSSIVYTINENYTSLNPVPPEFITNTNAASNDYIRAVVSDPLAPFGHALQTWFKRHTFEDFRVEESTRANVPTRQTAVYGFSIRLQEPFVYDPSCIIFQCHHNASAAEGSAIVPQVPFRIQSTKSGLTLTTIFMENRYGSLNGLPNTKTTTYLPGSILGSAFHSLPLGVYKRIGIRIHWDERYLGFSAGNYPGNFELWVDGIQVANINFPIGYGPYKSNYPNGAADTLTAYNAVDGVYCVHFEPIVVGRDEIGVFTADNRIIFNSSNIAAVL